MQGIIHLYYNVTELKPCDGLSEEILNFFAINLKCNPVTTANILAFFQNNFNDEIQIRNIHKLYINALYDELFITKNIEMFISLLSILQFNKEFVPDVIDKILKHLPRDILFQYKKQIFISLIAQKCPEIITEFSKAMDDQQCEEFHLTPDNMLQLCYQDKTHWLLKAIQVYKSQIHDMKNVTFKINNFTKQILVIVLIDIMNKPEQCSLSSLVQQLNNLFSILNSHDPSDEELRFYTMEVKRELTIIKFCLENNYKLSSCTSIFNQILSQSALAVVSQLCNLSKLDRYKVSRLLNTNNDLLNDLILMADKHDSKEVKLSNKINWDIMTYNSYCALINVIDSILDSSEVENLEEVTKSLEEVNRLVASLYPIEYRLEIMENIFTCLFLRYEQFSYDDDVQNSPCGAHSDCSYFFSKKQMKTVSCNKSSVGFICSSGTVQIILNTLKHCLESLEEKVNNDKTETGIATRFKNLTQYVNHALWKHQLVSTLSPDIAPVPKLCLDYVDVAETSEDDDCDIDLRISRKKLRVKRRHTNPKSNSDIMISSLSANVEGMSFKYLSFDTCSIIIIILPTITGFGVPSGRR